MKHPTKLTTADERQGLLVGPANNGTQDSGLLEMETPDETTLSRVLSDVSDDIHSSQRSSMDSNGEALTWCGIGSERMESIVRTVKYTYSLCLLAFCIKLIAAGIFADETPIAKATHWSVAFPITAVLITWLGMLEGGQGCLVGLQPISKDAYEESHSISHQCATLAHKGDNLNRFIVGRQFLVVLVVFAMNLCCSVVKDAVVPGFSPAIVHLTLESGLAVMLITVILGQLSAEVNATECMLDFINTRFMLVTTWMCLAIESSGLLHSVYLVQFLFELLSGKPVTSDENPRTVRESVFYWVRVLVSFVFLVYSSVITISGLVNEQTTAFHGIPDAASVAIFVGLVCFLGMLEAMQIALFAVVNLPNSALHSHPVAKSNCDLAFEGDNFQSFLIGRQICVTMTMFLLARFTTTDVLPGENTIMGISHTMQLFFNTGLPGAFITTIVASLAWRIFASSFPIPFLANPLVNATIRLCLLLEASGVFSTAWLLAITLKKIVGFQVDEIYIGPLYKGEKDAESQDDITLGLSDTSSSRSSDYGSTAEVVLVV